MKYHKFTSKTLFPNRNYAPILSVFQRVSTDRCLSPYRQRLFPFSLSEYQLSTTPQACVIIPDLLLLHTVGEEGERVREAPQGGERERESEETKILKWRRRGGRHPVTKQLRCQKARRTRRTRSSTHARRVNKGGGAGGSWSVTTKLPRMGAAY